VITRYPPDIAKPTGIKRTLIIAISRIMLHGEVVNEESKDIKVPYILLDSSDLSKVAFAINVQLMLNDANEQHSNQNSLPFVFPNDFDNVKDREGDTSSGFNSTLVTSLLFFFFISDTIQFCSRADKLN
jgi:hypothetical protein